MPGRPLSAILDVLEKAYGPPPAPRADPLELILLENIGYLVSDEKREAAFDALRRRVGLTPERILAARSDVLYEVASMGGMLPEQRVGKLIDIAETARKLGDLRALVRGEAGTARKALRRFPGIGHPGVEKILLFAGAQNVLALESNGLRVLLRLGYGQEKKSYAATYKSVQAAALPELRDDGPWLVRAHLLLRRHGQELCTRSRPRCDLCGVRGRCAFARQTV
jgi:endonuclease-3